MEEDVRGIGFTAFPDEFTFAFGATLVLATARFADKMIRKIRFFPAMFYPSASFAYYSIQILVSPVTGLRHPIEVGRLPVKHLWFANAPFELIFRPDLVIYFSHLDL
jgi:hypothetical protein